MNTSAPADVLGDRLHTKKVLSSLRLKVAFMVFVSALMVGMCGLIFGLVSHIFDELTPAIRGDLSWKAERGAAELAQSTQYGMVLGDAHEISRAFARYETDPDILGIVATDQTGKIVAQHGKVPGDLQWVWHQRPREVRERADAFAAWSESTIEGSAVGRIAVFVSPARIEAGARLQREILWTAIGGCGLGVLASLIFVGFYIGPLIQVTEAAFARLEQTTRAALEAVRLKGEFLANMSHEIRTPMNGVLGMLELLRGTTLDAKQRRYTNTLSTSAKGLMTVLNDILDFSKIEAGKVDLQLVPCEPRALLEEVAELFAARAQSKQLELLCHVHPDVPACIEVDADRLRQVVNNLVGNAIKFTDHGEVVVRASATVIDDQQRLLELCVTDTGIGMDAAQQAQLFEAFSQVDGSSTRRFGGTGLGLAISKQLVLLMGGELSVSSERGRGSQFFVRIPVRVVPEQTTRLSLVGRGTRALIVDDNATNRLLLEELLSSWGIRTESASNGLDALRALEECEALDPFRLVITDMHMPEMDGLTLARAIRGAHAELPLLMLTSLSDTSTETSDPGLFAGVLSKPVRSAELESKIARALGDSSRAAAPSEQRVTNAPSAMERKRKLLIAEDNPINQEVLVEMLSGLGYAADVVENGRLAVAAWASGDYPLIVMDCQMPELDGYQAAREIREREGGGARVPIIAATAHAFVGERERALAAGMDDYITKPLDQNLLAAALQRWWPRDPAEATLARPSLLPPSAAPVSGVPSLDPTVNRSQGVLRVFLRHVPGQLSAIESAVQANDAQAIQSAAHKLKGSCLSVGVPRMAALCAEMEQIPTNLAELNTRLNAEFSRVRERLTELLALKSA